MSVGCRERQLVRTFGKEQAGVGMIDGGHQGFACIDSGRKAAVPSCLNRFSPSSQSAESGAR